MIHKTLHAVKQRDGSAKNLRTEIPAVSSSGSHAEDFKSAAPAVRNAFHREFRSLLFKIRSLHIYSLR
jgi:hypothetical protein